MNPLIRKTFYLLPVQWRYSLRRLLYMPHDLVKKRLPMEPPKGMIFTGRGDFLELGADFFLRFEKYGGITPDDTILDIGSGIGRMAVPFTKFLSKDGQYDGFDIVKQGVDWCTKNITTKFPNFRFRWIPLRNELYNLSTADSAARLRFPYADERFDFIFLTSVFTHMMPEDVENYAKEISRVIKPGKRCMASFFLLDEDSVRSMKQTGLKNFPYSHGHYSLMDLSVKEANVAYQKEFIFDLFESHGFEIEHFFRGSWSGLESTELGEHQDVLVLKRNIKN
ncbi:class I SAM-dependent methyltransferase [Flavobacterium silvaticum]|uniref:Class I SAM-dependent methyltransferase n=1 Tax=Flavobacterium silvaticum TaxID=1852020 RepID=A0A972JGH9_9FLAO|nr:class I SAM-dependent methyltransferase [Flavobacterium silvaticum]NMH26880.1 class I SAM-dependent methyltransferase [Flavobacterium silvaticum]